MWAIAVIYAIAATIAGTFSATSTYKDWESTLDTAKMNLQEAKEGEEYTQSSYQVSMQEMEESLAQTQETQARNIQAETSNRANTALANSAAAVATQQDAYAELSALKAEGIQEVGSVNQEAAVSGFRKTEGTTQAANVEDAQEAADTEYRNKLRSIKATNFVNYLTSTNEYSQSTYNLESYRQTLRDAITNYSTQSQALTEEANYKIQQYENAIDYYESMVDYYSSGWNKWWTVIGSFFGASSSMAMQSAEAFYTAATT